MSKVRRINLKPKIFSHEIMTPKEYDAKEIDPELEVARQHFLKKDYPKAYSSFSELMRRYTADNINHKLSDFYLTQIKKLDVKPENKNQEKTCVLL